MKETELINRQKQEERSRISDQNKSDENENDYDYEEEEEESDSETKTLLPPQSSSLNSNPFNLEPHEKELLRSSLQDDFFAIFTEVKFLAPLFAFLFALIGIYLALDPFTDHPKRPIPMTQEEFVSLIFFNLI